MCVVNSLQVRELWCFCFPKTPSVCVCVCVCVCARVHAGEKEPCLSHPLLTLSFAGMGW